MGQLDQRRASEFCISAASLVVSSGAFGTRVTRKRTLFETQWWASARHGLRKHFRFFSLIGEQAGRKKLLSDQHLTVDGTLIEAWAGRNSFQHYGAAGAPQDPLRPAAGSTRP
jgi:hypothetical protein